MELPSAEEDTGLKEGTRSMGKNPLDCPRVTGREDAIMHSQSSSVAISMASAS